MPKAVALDADTARLALRLWRDWVRPYWPRIAVSMLFMAVVAATTGAYPLLIDHAYTLFEARDPDVTWTIPALVLAVTVVKGVAFYIQAVMVNAVAARVMADMQKVLFGHLLGADLATLTAQPPGELISRFTNDLTFIRNGLTRIATGLVRDLLTVIALAGSMLYLDWVLSLVVIAVYPLAAVPIVTIGRRLRRVSRETQGHMGGMTALLGESLGGARMVKTYQLEAYEQARAETTFDRLYDLLMRGVRARAKLDPTLEVLGGVAVGGVIAFAGWRMAGGIGSVGEFTGFVSALLIAAQPVRAIGTMNATVQEGLAAAQRLFDMLDTAPSIVDAPDAMPLRIRSGGIVLRGVRFGYVPGATALAGIDLEVPPGTTVALVGRSGAGKSTVFNLIPRLFDVDAGTVEIDGQDVRSVTLTSLRAAIGVVSQDITLFNDTVRANIAFGRPDADRAAVENAARAAAAHDFIERLPMGYDTIVGDRGTSLSGGERQRVALARAILKDAPILLLDEATSALDAESERLVQRALARLAAGRTTLVIAHRLATVRAADRIVVLDEGRVVEQGTHAQLLLRDGLYARLCRIQFRPDDLDPSGGPMSV